VFQVENKYFSQDYHSKNIYLSNYGQSDPHIVATQQTQLMPSQRQDLENLMQKFKWKDGDLSR
jgi:hypothetical protein